MSRTAWHIARDGDSVILSRRPGARALGPGIWAHTRLPGGLRAAVLAHEVRKDVWRALQGLRGFSPVIEIQPCSEQSGFSVRAGGVVLTQPPASLHARLQAVLEDANNRARWITHARRSRS